VTGNGTVLRLCRPAGDHHVFADMRPCLGLGSGPWHAQRTASTQIAHQLALEGTSALDVERLVDGFVRDAHGWIIGEVNPQAMRNLLW